jgi:NTE family protein
VKKKRPSVGIALDTGGAKGGAHIGVMDVLVENGVPVDIVVGSSAGAVVGALYATGSLGKIKTVVRDLTLRESLGYYVDPVFPRSGFLAGKKARTFFHSILGDVKIEDLPIRFAAVATDLHTGETVVIDRGLLVDAVMASISLPGIFKPVIHMDRLLTDGGVTDPLPLDVLKRYAPDITIAVNLHPRMPDRFDNVRRKAILREERKVLEKDVDVPSWIMERVSAMSRSGIIQNGIAPLARNIFRRLNGNAIRDSYFVEVLREQFGGGTKKPAPPRPHVLNIFDVLLASANIQQYQKNKLILAHESHDVLIAPDVTDISSLEFSRVEEAIAEGRRKAAEAIGPIRTLLKR